MSCAEKTCALPSGHGGLCRSMLDFADARALRSEVEQLRGALREWLSEVEAGEADSENEHAGCLCHAADRIVVVLAGGKS